jgi:hypothetical protein
MREKAGQAAGQAQGQWQAMQADAAEKHAEIAAEDAADAVDYALWTVDAARLAVLDAIDARARADERAAALRAG